MKKSTLIFGFGTLAYFFILFVLYSFESMDKNSNIDSFGNAIWYSIVTITTVGYGDYYPVTTAGRIISLFFIIGSFGALSFIITQINIKIQEYMEAKKFGLNGTNMQGHIIIFGNNRFSSTVIDEILSVGKQVALVLNKKDDIEILREKYKDKKLFFYLCEYDNYAALEKINIQQANSVFVSFPDDSESLVHIINLQSHFKNISIIVSLKNPSLKETFTSAGVLFAISQEEIASKLIASYIFEPNAAMLTEDLMTSQSLYDNVDMQEYLMTTDSPFITRTYWDAFIELKRDYNAVLLGIYKAKEKKLRKNPENEIIIELNDHLVVLADGDASVLESLFQVEQGYTVIE